MKILHALFGWGQHTWLDNWSDTYQPHVQIRNCRHCGNFETRLKPT